MTRKKRIVSARAGRVRTVIDEPILPDESPEEDPFQFALQEFGEDAGLTLHVYRYDPMTGKARYAKSVPFQKEIHGLEWLQRMFGAGDYLLRFYDSEGKSKNRTVSVDEDPSRRETVAPAPPAASASRDELVSILREQNNLILSALLKGGAQQAPAPAAENSVTLKILDAVLPQIFQKQDNSAQLFSVLEKGIAIAMDAKTDSEGGMAGLIRSVAKELGPVLGEFARARMMAPPQPPFSPPVMRPPALNPGNENSGPPYSPPPAPPPPPSPPNGEAPATPEETARAMVEGTVRYGVELVERAAQAKERPEDVGDWILGEIPPNYYDHLAGLTYERLTTINPRYASLERTWIEAVLTHLRKEAQGGTEEVPGEEEEHGST